MKTLSVLQTETVIEIKKKMHLSSILANHVDLFEQGMIYQHSFAAYWIRIKSVVTDILSIPELN